MGLGSRRNYPRLRIAAQPGTVRPTQPDDDKGVAETRYSRPEAIEVGGRDE